MSPEYWPKNKLDSKQHVTEHVATTTVAVGAGLGAAAALGTSALATGGTALIAAGAAAATAYAMNKIDKATYGAEDIRFSPNLVSKRRSHGGVVRQIRGSARRSKNRQS